MSPSSYSSSHQAPLTATLYVEHSFNVCPLKLEDSVHTEEDCARWLKNACGPDLNQKHIKTAFFECMDGI